MSKTYPSGYYQKVQKRYLIRQKRRGIKPHYIFADDELWRQIKKLKAEYINSKF